MIDRILRVCYECHRGKIIVPFIIKYEDYDWPDEYLCSTKCLNDFIVVAEAEAVLDRMET